MTNIALIVFSKDIRQFDNLYSLNDLHQASGGEDKHRPKHRPNQFIRLEQMKALIHEIKCCADLPNTPVKAVKRNRADGARQGTYVCKELVYAYAMWVSPKFNLAVIQAFDAMTVQSLPPTTITPAQQAELQAIVVDKSSGNDKHRAMMWSRFNRHFKIAQYSQLPIEQFRDPVQYMQSLPTFGDPAKEENDAERVQRAFEMASTVAAEVSKAVFNALCSEIEDNLPRGRWVFGYFAKPYKEVGYMLYVFKTKPDTCIASLKELAEGIVDGYKYLPYFTHKR
jgi:hypothetical protein